MDFAVGADSGVYNLVGIEDVLPYIEEGVSVSKGQDDEGGIDAQNTFDVFLVFLNVVGMQGFVCRVADVTVPVQKIRLIFSADDH